MISSTQNDKIKQVRGLLSSAKNRKEEGLFVIEGVRMAGEVLQAELPPRLILYSQQLSDAGFLMLEIFRERKAQIEEVKIDLLHKLSDTRHSQGILLVLPIPEPAEVAPVTIALALDSIHDPGNLGTILRSAAGFGLTTVLLAPRCADPFSPKVVRAGMGAHFRLNLNRMGAEQIANFCKRTNQPPLHILLADATDGQLCWECDLTQSVCLIVGGEAQGASHSIRAISDEAIFIPMLKGIESYNAAISASILLYEAYRQRNNA